jgi:Flp pilus assembly protein TadG
MVEIFGRFQDTQRGHIVTNIQNYATGLTGFQSFLLQDKAGEVAGGVGQSWCAMSARLRFLVTTLLQNFVRLRADQHGNIAVIMGFLLPPLIGALGLGFEVGNWYLTTRAMQNAADSAAIAAATNASSNYATEAQAVAAQYGFVDGSNNATVTASNAAACPSGGNTCYSVTIATSVPLLLSEILGYQGNITVNGVYRQSLTSTAVAKSSPAQQPICLLALNQTATALRTNGAPNSDFTGCTVMSNSAATCNGSNLKATFGLAHGSNSGCGIAQQSNIPVVTDPYLAMAAHIPANTCSSYAQETKHGSSWSGGISWSGSMSTSGITQDCGDVRLTGNVVINTPDSTTGATLVIENGQLDLNGYTLSTANGSAVTIVFSGTSGNYSHIPTDNSTGQGGTLNIQAPSGTSAPFQGMAIYQDPNLTTGVDITYKGNNPAWDISGGVYLPHSNLQMSGAVNKSSSGGDCFVMIADTININGTSYIYQQTPDGSGCNLAGLKMPTATIPGRTQLVY